MAAAMANCSDSIWIGAIVQGRNKLSAFVAATKPIPIRQKNWETEKWALFTPTGSAGVLAGGF
ncbi:MAG: hypothetical protein ACREIC_28685, partial [Limisphaerales bacterium]